MLIWRNGYDERVLTWDELARDAGLQVSGRTLRRHLRHMGYRRCVPCRKGWMSKEVATGRVKFAKKCLLNIPTLRTGIKLDFRMRCI